MRFSVCILLTVLFSCKKNTERSCFKSAGDPTERIVSVNQVDSLSLLKNLRYEIFQDSAYQIRVVGGENLVNLVEIEEVNGRLWIRNNNKCDFLRKFEDKIKVEIHLPKYSIIYVEPSDSILFKDTIVSNNLQINIRNGGGTLKLNTKSGWLGLIVSAGPGNFFLGGSAEYAEVKVQNTGVGDASNFNAKEYFAYQNSTGELKVNLEGANALVEIDGTGDVFYRGTPLNLELKGIGSGKLREY